MAHSRKFGSTLSKGAIGVMVALLALACESSQKSAQTVQDPSRFTRLEGEIARLSAKIGALENQVLQEHRNAARARQETQEQRERVTALEAQVQTPAVEPPAPLPPANNATSMQAEAELRLAYRALMRAIERLDISAEEKAALKTSLRPTRTLDRNNPWSVATYAR